MSADRFRTGKSGQWFGGRRISVVLVGNESLALRPLAILDRIVANARTHQGLGIASEWIIDNARWCRGLAFAASGILFVYEADLWRQDRLRRTRRSGDRAEVNW